MANGRIDVYFHSGESETDAESVGGANEEEATSPKQSKRTIEKSAIATGIVDYSKKAINYGISIMGDLNGDYQTQRKLQSAVNLAGTLIMMANYPVGTIAGVVSLATQGISQIIADNNANKEAALLRKRTGNESINNSEID